MDTSEMGIDGEWNFKQGKILLRKENGIITGTGDIPPTPPSDTSATKAGGLLNILAGLPRPGLKLKFNATIHNRAIKYRLETRSYTFESPILSNDPIIYEGIMIASENGEYLDLMEKKEDDDRLEFYRMKKFEE